MSVWHAYVTDEAKSDLREAAVYMREQLHSPKAALDFLDSADKAVSKIEINPFAYPPVSDFALARAGYRRRSIGNFTMFFTADEKSRSIFIERVLYAPSNWPEKLR